MVGASLLLFPFYAKQSFAIRVARNHALLLGTVDEHLYEDAEYSCPPHAIEGVEE